MKYFNYIYYLVLAVASIVIIIDDFALGVIAILLTSIYRNTEKEM